MTRGVWESFPLDPLSTIYYLAAFLTFSFTRLYFLFDSYTFLTQGESMYGKLFATMFTGSMVGSGAGAFAVWTHALANADCKHLVELNPPVLAALIGMDEGEVIKQIEKFCGPDPKSRTQDYEGRKLIHQGGFGYLVINHDAYCRIKTVQDQRAYFADKQREHRERVKLGTAKKRGPRASPKTFRGKQLSPPGTPLPGEVGYVARVENGQQEADQAPVEGVL